MPNSNLGTAIGKIVKSNTHVDYVCQVYSANEVAECPKPADYCFGGFVSILLDASVLDASVMDASVMDASVMDASVMDDSVMDDSVMDDSVMDDRGASGQLIGVIYNTLLMNPDYGSLGPRLSPHDDVAIFSPDYLEETATLVGVLALGWVDGAGQYHQGVPSLSATVNNAVHCLSDEGLRAFHQDAVGRLALRYAPLLLGQHSALTMPLLISIIDRLSEFFPDQRGQLKLMRNNLAWKSVVQPVG